MQQMDFAHAAEDLLVRRQLIDRKFGPDDVTKELTETVWPLLAAYDGDFSFLQDIKSKADQGLTDRQIASTANALAVWAKDKVKAQGESKGHFTSQALKQGYFTVVLEDGSHVTLRVQTWQANGKTYVDYLSGSDNESSYTKLAVIDKEGTGFWRSGGERQHKALDVLTQGNVDTLKTAGKAYAVESGRCYVCGKLLTTPESIELGIGPICRANSW